MKSFKRLLALAVASAVCGIAQANANTQYSTSFSVTGGALPHLRLFGETPSTPGTLGGSWVREPQQNAQIISKDLLSETVDPVTGEVTRTWGPRQYDLNRDSGGAGPLDLGDTKAIMFGPNEFTSTTGGAYVGKSSVSASLTTREHQAQATAAADWSKGFSLDANSSFSFSGIARLNITGDAAPANAFTTYNLDSSGTFASLTLGEASDRLWTRIGASVSDVAGSLADIFSYDVGPDGFLSLTITNNGSAAINGRVSISSFIGLSPSAAIAAPVPEPQTLALMLSGVAVVGWASRKKKAQIGQPAVA